jgi:hypothetical protein
MSIGEMITLFPEEVEGSGGQEAPGEAATEAALRRHTNHISLFLIVN